MTKKETTFQVGNVVPNVARDFFAHGHSSRPAAPFSPPIPLFPPFQLCGLGRLPDFFRDPRHPTIFPTFLGRLLKSRFRDSSINAPFSPPFSGWQLPCVLPKVHPDFASKNRGPGYHDGPGFPIPIYPSVPSNKFVPLLTSMLRLKS